MSKYIFKKEFKKKTASKRLFLEFLEDFNYKYTPPTRSFTKTFGLQVLRGTKKLIDKDKIIYTPFITCSKELTTKLIFNKLKRNKKMFKKISLYLPDFSDK